MSNKTLPDRSLIRVALVEDDVNFQNTLMAAIEAAPDITLLSVAKTRSAGLRMLDQAPADVLLVDLGLPDGSGIDVIRAAYVQWPDCNIMVSTTFGDEAHVMQSIEAGASGYLLKDSSSEGMLSEIRNLHAGGSPISPLIARRILMRFQSPGHSDTVFVRRRDSDKLDAVPTECCNAKKQGAVLSAQETRVLELVTKGFTSNEIAALMFISFHTVQTYVRRIYAKLEVSSKTEAIYEARNQGLLSR